MSIIRVIILLTAMLLLHRDVHAQLLAKEYPWPRPKTVPAISVAGDVPKGLADGATLTFETYDICFDGGSYGAFFKRQNGERLVLFFPNPLYWSDKAKMESRQPVAIESKGGLVEIKRDSPLERRLLHLLAVDIASGIRDSENALLLIRVRDCLLTRRPLAEIEERFDPVTWEARPDERDPFGTANPFDDGRE